MKSLAKEPAARYQSCRELFDDLRNYRSLPSAQNPNATLPLGGTPQSNASHNTSANEYQFATNSRAHASRASSPSQTPLVRRNRTVASEPSPNKSRRCATLL